MSQKCQQDTPGRPSVELAVIERRQAEAMN
jgi:hypothetical protein